MEEFCLFFESRASLQTTNTENMFVDEQRFGKSCNHVHVRISQLCSCSCLCSNFLSLAPLSNLVFLSNPWKNFFYFFESRASLQTANTENMFVDEQRFGKSCVHVRVRISHLCSSSCLCSNFLSLAPLSNLVSLSNPWKNFFYFFESRASLQTANAESMFVDEQRFGKSCVHVRVQISHLCSCSFLCSNFLSLAPLSNLVFLSNLWKNFFPFFKSRASLQTANAESMFVDEQRFGKSCVHVLVQISHLCSCSCSCLCSNFLSLAPLSNLVFLSNPWKNFVYFLNPGLLCKQQTPRTCSSMNNDLEKVVIMFMFEFPNCVLVLVCVRISYPWPLFQI